MPPSSSNTPRKAPAAPTTPAIIALHPTKNCLLNLPGSLVNVLVGSNTPAQNVIVELTWKATSPTTGLTTTRSAFAGWTGMQAKRRTVASTSSRSGSAMREEATVEMDPAYARTVGLTEGTKIHISLHIDPPMAHTVHIEPLTPSDWEIIELHATFLELNLLSQIRAITLSHPLTIYLSPTSTASIKVTKVEPENRLITSAHSPAQFIKISPDAEVIVAPKTRQRRQSKSTPAAKSATSTVGKAKKKAEAGSVEGGGMFFRGVSLPTEDFYELDEEIKGGGKSVTVYLDPELLAIPPLRQAGYVSVTVVRPPGLAPPQDPQQAPPPQDQDAPNPDLQPATRIVAKLMPWENAPDTKHIALSRVLANALDISTRVGTMIRIEPACQPLAKTINIKVKIHPYTKAAAGDTTSVKWGGKHKSLEKEEGVRRLIQVLGKRERKRDIPIITAPGASGSNPNIGIPPPEHPSPGEGLLEGPITDGLVLPAIPDCPLWAGGLIKLEMSPSPDSAKESSKNINWFLPIERKYTLELSSEEVRQPISATVKYENHLLAPTPLPSTPIVGVDGIIDNVITNLVSSSSVLLAGPHLSGKSSILNLVANKLRKGPYYYQVINPGPMSKFADERVAVIKDEFTRWFMMARFAASLSTGGESGGSGGAVIILDDLERVCKAESAEPGAASDSGRARQIAEIVVSLVRRYATDGTNIGGGGNVVVLGACSGKENVHSWMVGGRGFREVVNLKGPDRDGRRRILEGVVGALRGNKQAEPSDATSSSTELVKKNAIPEKELDLLEIAGLTDGYMPGDLVLLVGRARHEAVVRVVDECKDDYAALPNTSFDLELKRTDFDKALKGFVPVGLRGVKLQTSGVNWKDIGGLTETRKILLETLEWPTKYAPIFANCPLRLRSGLLLYGYPGCGKTLLASAIAGECGLNFISVKGPEILNKYIGASEKSVRDLFERASSAKPCVLFFDEFDSIAPKRGHDSTGVTDRVVNQMLTQMDGAEGLDGVYVLAATSRPDLIDPALLRPGRLDKSLLCDLPHLEDRLDILRALSAEKLAVDPTVSLLEIAKRTEGYSGADLQAVLYNAHLEAIHDVIEEEERRVEHAEAHGDGDGKGGSGGGGGAGGNGGGAAGDGGDDGMGDSEFFQFVFGDSKGKLHVGPNGATPTSSALTAGGSSDLRATAESRSKRLAERAQMLAKLDLLKRRARGGADAHSDGSSGGSGGSGGSGSGGSGGKAGGDGGDATAHEEVIITWTHIEKSLATTRGSIAPDERRRLMGIYKEFVGSRNGEMKSGEGSTEVGGRSSLM
ncbi:P-loop containing nucleoside triphosphate hydrolase protein [Peziza echinospora]|nr:P-loop containing nucleoside triphosphate hydrolase protein [Peziza echinospora]